MVNRYLAIKNKHAEEVNNFPMAFSFNKEQFARGMEKLGLTAEDTDKVVSIGAGGYIRKEDAEAFKEMFDRHEKEMKHNIDSDTTGEGFIYEMFRYELNNHEFGYTHDSESTLDALGLTYDDVNNNENLYHGYTLAVQEILSGDDN